MTAAEAAAADSHNVDEVEEIDPDQASDRDSTVGSKRKGGRPVDPAWESCKRVANQNAGATNRAWIGVYMNCNHKVTSGMKVMKAGADGKTSSQMTMDSYADKGKLNKEQNKVLQRLLTLAFIMCGIPFSCVHT